MGWECDEDEETKNAFRILTGECLQIDAWKTEKCM
jgi:hypothetical protein